MWRISLIEPLVDPAEAPSSVTPNSTIDVSAVQSAKSALANPVVVIIDTVLNTPARIASSPSSTSWLASPTITTSEAAANSPSATRNSSSRRNTPSCRPTMPA